METTLIREIADGFVEFLHYIEWIYVILFIIITWLFNDFSEARNAAKWLTWWSRIPKLLRVFILGIVLIGVFGYFLRINTREEYFILVLSMFAGMVFYKIGIKQVLGWFSSRVLKIQK